MICDVYKSKIHRKHYLIVPTATDIDALTLDIYKEFGEQAVWKSIDLVPDKELIAINPKKAIANIEQYNYHVQMVG